MPGSRGFHEKKGDGVYQSRVCNANHCCCLAHKYEGGFQGFCVSALLYFFMITIAFVLYHETPISKMVQNATNTAQKIKRVLSGKAVENDDDSLVPAHMLNGTAAALPVPPSAGSPPASPTPPTQEGTLRRRKPCADANLAQTQTCDL